VLKDYNVSVNDGIGTCSGVVIQSDENDTFILTAGHCISGKYGLIRVGTAQYLYEVMGSDKKLDLALLYIAPIYVLPATKLADTAPKFGEDVWIMGNPGGVIDLLSKGIVSKEKHESRKEGPVTIYDYTGWRGSSGGGVYNQDMELVGITIEFGPQGVHTGYMYAVTLDAIKQFMEDVCPLSIE
jgi:S1-C subfamily serine protease